MKNIQKLDDLYVPFYVFCYGIILEVLCDFYTELEKFNATISTTHFALLLTINELKRIANMSACVCLHNNCYRAIELIDKAFEDEKDLARTAFSLSIIGRKYYQELAFNDDRELALFNSYEAKHQRIRNYFVFAIFPALFPPLEDQAIIRPWLKKEEKNKSDYEEDEEECSCEDSYSQDETGNLDQLEDIRDDELDETIPLDLPLTENYDITSIGNEVICNWARDEGLNQIEISDMKDKYVQWLSYLTNDIVEEFDQNSDNEYIFWMKMTTIKGWPIFSKMASIISNIPASEIENERIYSVKRNIIGKHAVRLKPVTITARTRVIMRTKAIDNDNSKS